MVARRPSAPDAGTEGPPGSAEGNLLARFLTVSSGTTFAQVAEAILGKQARGQNSDKDEVQP